MPKQKPSAGASERVRSAITGRFVKKSAAKRSPRTTRDRAVQEKHRPQEVVDRAVAARIALSAVLVLAVLCGFSTSALAARPATDEERELILDVFDSSLTPDRWRCYDVIVSTVNERWAAIHIATYESGARVCPNSTGDGHAAYHYIYGGWEENWQASEPPICEQYGMPGAVGRDLGRDGVALCAPTRGTYCGSYGDHGDGETRWAMTPTFRCRDLQRDHETRRLPSRATVHAPVSGRRSARSEVALPRTPRL